MNDTPVIMALITMAVIAVVIITDTTMHDDK
jgi:hypothetical protein